MSTCTCAGQVDFRCPEHGNLNTAEASSPDADLATLRDWSTNPDHIEAVKRVEAEIARLREAEEREQMALIAVAKRQEQLEAAERKLARLQEGLRKVADSYDPARPKESAQVMYDIARSNVPERDEHGNVRDPEWAERTIERWQPEDTPGKDGAAITVEELRGHVTGGAMRSKSPAPGQAEDTPGKDGAA